MADHHDDHTPNKGTNGPSHCDEQDVFRCFVAEADNQERQSLKQLQILVARMCESLALWKILCDHQFHVICAALSVVSHFHFPFSNLLNYLLKHIFIF